MITWLAQQPVENSWKDYAPFAAGFGTVIAAFVAGWFLSRNSKRTPYENLESLSKARAQLADQAEALPFVDQSIAYALAQIRLVEGTTADAEPTSVAREADRQVAKRRRKQGIQLLGLYTVVWILGAVFIATVDSAWSGPFSGALGLTFGLVVATSFEMIWPGVSSKVAAPIRRLISGRR
ncbi:hypothetical protein [Nocardia sp. NPDC051832]|uniref:hypothetical protein n=1 Tax=Nocardia sp. NPDC051832 TaxID=3155673 RepID=UPI0034311700